MVDYILPGHERSYYERYLPDAHVVTCRRRATSPQHVGSAEWPWSPRIQLPRGHCTDNNRGGARQLYLKLPWGQCSWNSCSLVAGGWRTLNGTEVYWRVTLCFGENGQFVLIVALWIWACTDDLYQVNVLDYFLDPSLQLNSSALIPSQLQLPKYSLLYMWSWQWL